MQFSPSVCVCVRMPCTRNLTRSRNLCFDPRQRNIQENRQSTAIYIVRQTRQSYNVQQHGQIKRKRAKETINQAYSTRRKSTFILWRNAKSVAVFWPQHEHPPRLTFDTKLTAMPVVQVTGIQLFPRITV